MQNLKAKPYPILETEIRLQQNKTPLYIYKWVFQIFFTFNN
jgi:hypothetical protein